MNIRVVLCFLLLQCSAIEGTYRLRKNHNSSRSKDHGIQKDVSLIKKKNKLKGRTEKRRKLKNQIRYLKKKNDRDDRRSIEGGYYPIEESADVVPFPMEDSIDEGSTPVVDSVDEDLVLPVEDSVDEAMTFPQEESIDEESTLEQEEEHTMIITVAPTATEEPTILEESTKEPEKEEDEPEEEEDLPESLQFGEPIMIPRLLPSENVTYTLDPAPEGPPTSLQCKTSGPDGDIDLYMYNLNKDEYLCESQGATSEELCVLLEVPGDIIQVTVWAYEEGTNLMLECNRNPIPILQPGDLTPFALRDDEELLYIYEVESNSTFFCEVGAKSNFASVAPEIFIPDGPQCSNDETTCFLSTESYSGYVYVSLSASSYRDNHFLTCFVGPTQTELAINQTIELKELELGSFEYTIEVAATQVQCQITASGSDGITIQMQYEEAYEACGANEDCQLNALFPGGTLLVNVISAYENAALECNLVLLERAVLEPGETVTTTIETGGNLVYEFVSGETPSNVFCNLRMINNSSSATITMDMANSVRDYYSETRAIAFPTSDGTAYVERWLEPNTTWFVILQNAAFYDPEEVELTCDYTTYDFIVPGEAVVASVDGYFQNTGFRYDVSTPSTIACDVSAEGDSFDGNIIMIGADELSVEAYYDDTGFFSDVCFEFWSPPQRGAECSIEAVEPQIVTIQVVNNDETAKEFSLMCTVDELDEPFDGTFSSVARKWGGIHDKKKLSSKKRRIP